MLTENQIIQRLLGRDSIETMDDCAFIPIASGRQGHLHTCDAMVSGTHFKEIWSDPGDLAIKLIQSNISDLISSGGIPEYAFLSIGIPSKISKDYLVQLLDALHDQLLAEKIVLSGGDTYRSSALVLQMHLMGPVHPNCQTEHPCGITRQGGATGHNLYITGNIGCSGLGLDLLQNNTNPILDYQKKCIAKHLRPQARRDLCNALYNKAQIKAMLDISDGLLVDAKRLALASQISLHIELTHLPIDPDLKENISIFQALTSGEEYELLYLSGKQAVPGTYDHATDSTCIGHASRAQQEALFIYRAGLLQDSLPVGFKHFAD